MTEQIKPRQSLGCYAEDPFIPGQLSMDLDSLLWNENTIPELPTTVDVFEPGAEKSKLLRELGWYQKKTIYRFAFRSPSAIVLVYASTKDKAEDIAIRVLAGYCACAAGNFLGWN